MNYNHIAIEGVIGAGKTSLARKLVAYYSGTLVLEQFEDNAFLPKFYQDQSRYAFPLELSFLADRFKAMKQINRSASLFENVFITDYILAKSLIFATVTLDSDEYQLYRELYYLMAPKLAPPDLTIYLYAPAGRLLANITERKRSYEQNISETYLKQLQEGYLSYFNQVRTSQRVLLLDVSKADFVKSQSDFDKIVQILDRPLSKGVHRQVV